MFRIIYKLSIWLFSLTIKQASLYNKKAGKWIRGRENLWDELEATFPIGKSVVWFHCASLGEFEQGRPVIEAYRNRRPNDKLLLTFFSPSGFDIQKNYQAVDWVFYLPIDLEKNVKRFLNLVRPRVVIFVKYEFWYEYLYQLWQKKIPVFLISANFRSSQWFFKWYGKPFRKMLDYFYHFFVQNKISENLLNAAGYKNVTVAGDTRFDRVSQIAGKVQRNYIIESFKQKETVLVAGSTWKGDEQLLIRYINYCSKPIKWVLAPHEIHGEHIKQITAQLNVPYQRYSEAAKDMSPNIRVLIIDNIGMLSGLYKYGELAYVGGGFGSGIHNILEPATFGIPVIFGPHYHKFQEAIDLISLNAAFSIKSYEELMNILDEWFMNPERLINAGKHAKNYIQDQQGATNVIVDNLLNV